MEKPKRKYTLTEKALAANRRNLILAREVDPEIRYRPTPKRLAAARANLTRALATLRAASLAPDGYPQKPSPEASIDDGQSTDDRPSTSKWSDSPAYGSGFTRGLHAVSLRRSARLAGETSAAFDAHVEMFRQALAPGNCREQRLARGIAEVVWRRLRLFRGQARWERAALIYRLREAARGPSPEEWADGALTPAGLASDLAREMDRILSTGVELFDAKDKLNARLERLSRLWVVGRGGDPRLFEHLARGRVRDGRLADRSPESMGNPFRKPGEVAEVMNGRRAPALLSFSPRGWGGGALHAHFHSRSWMVADGCAAPHGLMLALCREGRGATGNSEEFDSEGLGFESIDKFKELWTLAWEGISKNSHASVSVTVTGYTPEMNTGAATGTDRAGQAMSRQEFAPHARIPAPESRLPEALWSRLQLYANAAQREAGEVQLLLAAQISGRMFHDLSVKLGPLPQGAALQPGHAGETAALLMELILLFNRGENTIHEVGAGGDSIGAMLYDFLVELFGPSSDFNLLKPGYAQAAFTAQNARLRREVEQRLARDAELEGEPDASRGTPAERLVQAENHLQDVMQLNYLCLFDDTDEPLEDLFDGPGGLLSALLPGVQADPEWAPRYRAAAASGMVRLPGWKFETRAQSNARVGLSQK